MLSNSPADSRSIGVYKTMEDAWAGRSYNPDEHGALSNPLFTLKPGAQQPVARGSFYLRSDDVAWKFAENSYYEGVMTFVIQDAPPQPPGA